MATSTTVSNIYDIICAALLEPYEGGLYPGLSLGIVTQPDFLKLFAVVVEDFVNRTGLIWAIFSQQLDFNQTTYMQPNDLNTVKVCFVGSQYIEHSTLSDLDDWLYDWRAANGTPEYWHSDGLPPKTVEVAANPNYTGAGYVLPADPTAQPPFGVYGLFNGSTQGRFTGTLNTAGTAATWVSGALFDLNWGNYSPPLNITIAGTAYPIASVTDGTDIVLQNSAGNQSGSAFSVSVGNDGNLTMVGTAGLSSITYTLDSIVPVVPDDLCFYLSYGILARIFSTDGEAKDLQRSYYCQSRYMEGVNALAAISGEMLEIN